MIAALLFAAMVFLPIRQLGDFLVWRYYLDEESKIERREGYVKDFQDYVVRNKLSVNDAEKMSGWSGGAYVDILIYKDSNLVYAPDWFIDFENDETTGNGEYTDLNESDALESGDTSEETVTDSADTETPESLESEDVGEGESSLESGSETETELESQKKGSNDGWFSGDRGFEQYLTQEAREAYLERLGDLLSGNSELSPIYCRDGTLLITVVDYSEEFMHNLIFAVSVIFAVLLFAIIMLVAFTVYVSRINRLANKVRRVESGELDMPIKIEGNDELAMLAANVNSMRNAVVDNMTKEQQAWEANAELITAMSHDVRTPLTVLLGYLDLLEMQNPDEEQKEYIVACRDNAMRLKRLSDDMFSYFLVFGRREVNIDMSKTVDCESLMHMIAEKRLWLEEKSFTVNLSGDPGEFLINIDDVYFNRVLDNVISNIEKYADASEPIEIKVSNDSEELAISIRNLVRVDENRPESNGIGTRTCRRIMEKMSGHFESETEKGYYTAHIRIRLGSAAEKNK